MLLAGVLAGMAVACGSPPRTAAAATMVAERASPVAPRRLDHHTVVDADRYPWSAVGKLFNSVGGACTAVAVARDRVLTAAHCLYNYRARRFLPARSIHVLLGYARGAYRIHARVTAIRLGPGYDPADEVRTAGVDWAVLTLAEPLPAGERPIGAVRNLPPAGTALALGGFPQDRAFLMTADTRCRLLGAIGARRLLSHDCVIQHGDSGAPLLVASPDGTVQVCGVAVGFLRSGARKVGIAAPFTAATLGSLPAAR